MLNGKRSVVCVVSAREATLGMCCRNEGASREAAVDEVKLRFCRSVTLDNKNGVACAFMTAGIAGVESNSVIDFLTRLLHGTKSCVDGTRVINGIKIWVRAVFLTGTDVRANFDVINFVHNWLQVKCSLYCLASPLSKNPASSYVVDERRDVRAER